MVRTTLKKLIPPNEVILDYGRGKGNRKHCKTSNHNSMMHICCFLQTITNLVNGVQCLALPNTFQNVRGSLVSL
jgi:hypothetical protein